MFTISREVHIIPPFPKVFFFLMASITKKRTPRFRYIRNGIQRQFPVPYSRVEHPTVLRALSVFPWNTCVQLSHGSERPV